MSDAGSVPGAGAIHSDHISRKHHACGWRIPAGILAALLYGYGASALPDAASQPARQFQRLGVRDGLSTADTAGFAQDRYGFIWIATGMGLNRYDGYGVEDRYVKAAGPLHPMHLAFDAAGALWIATYDAGIARYDEARDTFERLRHDPGRPQTLASDTVLSIAPGLRGEVWACLNPVGMNRIDADGSVQRELAELSGELADFASQCSTLYLDGSLLWIGSRREGLGSLNLQGGARSAYVQTSGLRPGRITAIVRHPRLGLVAAIARVGIDRLDDTTGRFVAASNAVGARCRLPDVVVASMSVDREGALWMATGSGVYVLDPVTLDCSVERHDPDVPASLPHNKVLESFVDRTGIVWLATSAGVARHDPRTRLFASYRRVAGNPHSLHHNDVMSLLEDSRGDLWIGTNGGGLTRRTRASGIHRRVVLNAAADPSVDEVVYDVEEDDEEHLWIATTRGIYRLGLAGGPVRRLDVPPAAASTSVALRFDGEHMWLGTYNRGVWRMSKRGEVIAHYAPDPGNPQAQPSKWIWDMARDASGKMWVAGVGGVSRFDSGTGTFRTYRSPGVSTNRVAYSLAADGRGRMWVGTEAGVEIVDPASGRIELLTAADGLASDETSCVLVDRTGVVWISTVRGLTRLNPPTPGMQNFDAADGLQSEFNIGACAQGADGTLYLGGPEGYHAFAPVVHRAPSPPPPTQFTELVLYERTNVSGAATRDLGDSRPIHLRSSISLDYRERIFGLKFAALDFANPSANRYQYRLRGADERWIEVTAKPPLLTFAGLGAGHYRLEVRGANRDGVWSEQPAGIDVSVAAAPWATNWAYGTYSLCALALIVLLYRARTRAMRARSIQLEGEIQQRTALIEQQRRQVEEMDEARRRLVAAASHDLRTPLAAVQGYLETLTVKATELSSTAGRTYLESALGATRRVTRLVNELFDLARIEDPERELQFESFNLAELVADVAMEAAVLAQRGEVTLRTELAHDLPAVRGDIGLVERVIFNLIENAIRHSPPGTVVTVSAACAAQFAQVSVTDQGKGIPPEYLQQVFEPFFRVPGDAAVPGDVRAGLGLATARRIVLLHGGDICAGNAHGGGAILAFTLPLSCSEHSHK